jgi:hypothetical protein
MANNEEVRVTSKTKQAKKGRWVASDPAQIGEGWWDCEVYHAFTLETLGSVNGPTRAECRRRAAAIRDLANKEGW